MTTVELEDPAGDVVEEVAVVGDSEHGSRVAGQMLLEPGDALGVQMVRGLVQQEQAGGFEQELAQRDPAPLTAGQLGHVGVAGRQAQRVHRLVELAVELPGVRRLDPVDEGRLLGEEGVEVRVRRGHLLVDLLITGEDRADLPDAVLDIAADVLRLVQRRFLREHADGETGAQRRVPVARLVKTCHDLEQRRLASTVRADDTDLRAGQEGQADVVKNDFVAVGFAHFAHLEDVLRHAVNLMGLVGLSVRRTY